jgi:glycerol uptake facilitator protein
MQSPWLGEFLGTLILVLLGNSVVANVNLKRSYAAGGGWIVITAAWGFAVMFGVLVAIACGSAEAHLNPAVTLANAIMTGSAVKIVPYCAAQLAGAFCGATLVWLYFLPHWGETPDAGTKRACYCTAPAIRRTWPALFCEFLATAILIFVIAAFSSKRVAAAGLVPGLSPCLVGTLVWSLGMSLGGTTGYAMNPARDLAPRIAHSLWPIAGKGSSEWGYAWVPVLGPMAGAALAAWLTLAIGF